MQFLAAPRSEVWPGDTELDLSNNLLIDRLVKHICQAYKQPDLCEDRILRDGLVNHLIPACLRQRFHLWFPSIPSQMTLPDQYKFEYQVAGELVAIIREQTGFELPVNEVPNVAMLLRAAFIRARPYSFRRVIVVCPSGMATAQLLVARLEARFPRLGNLEVVSLRQLNPETAASAELILTTVPLSKSLVENYNVLQVHPLLMPADIDAITRFLS
jgi:mannitol operon transcriptional antiterminator